MPVRYYKDVEQGTPEWLEIRKDKLSGTDSHKIKVGWTKEKILENKRNDTGFTGNYYTRRGHTLEPLAIKTFEQIHNVKIHNCGYITNDKYADCMHSPDGFNKKNKLLVEIKGFMEDHHLKCIEKPDEEIVSQIAWGIMIGEYDKAVLININPDCEENQYNETWFSKDDEIIISRIALYKDFLNNDGKPLKTTSWNEECKKLAEIENEISSIESNLVISDNGKEFAKYLELSKTAIKKRKELQAAIKESMISGGYKTIENKYMRASLSDVTKFVAIDVEKIPKKFTKTEIDTAKVRAEFNKTGMLPSGTDVVHEYRLNLKSK